MALLRSLARSLARRISDFIDCIRYIGISIIYMYIWTILHGSFALAEFPRLCHVISIPFRWKERVGKVLSWMSTVRYGTDEYAKFRYH